MEKEENDGSVTITITTTTTNSVHPPHVPPSKKRSGLSLFRAALFTVRRNHQPDKKAHVNANAPDYPAETHSIWRSFLCGMRPLHLQQLEDCPSLLPHPQLVERELFHDTPLPPPSPGCSDDGMSRYASAEDLQALDKSKDGDDDEEDATSESRNSHSIDMRADEFIARFYEQMRLQRLDSCSDQDD
ncbi:uncharacterized protein [Elaeis guineensis]|uniref:Uncharacterized protein LOC109505240 n=1 Tax=Elaeis guineensis var. tenera TaxID=51953 RepID=A0A6J0PDT6_ELAGV|nr:uncharacterized protein LOC109505240 [Elaeis guineensis]